MKAGAWNCRGSNSTKNPTFLFLKWFASSQALDFLFLAKTKSSVKELEPCIARLGFSGWGAVNQLVSLEA